MQPFVFGGSYDAVAGNRLAYDQMAAQAAERDRQARVDAFDKAQQAQIFQQRQSEEDNRQRQAQAYQFAQAAQSEQDRQNEMSRRAFEFGVTSKQHDESENRIATSEADRLQLQKDTNATNLKLGNEDADYREAVNRIDRGLISHPSDIDTLFPNMNTDQKARAASYWKEQNDKAHEDYQSLTGYAKAANSLIQSDNKTGLPLSEDDAYALLAKDKNAKKWLPNLRFDEASQQWTPSMPKPFTVPATTTGTNAPAAAPVAPAPGGFQIPFAPSSARIPITMPPLVPTTPAPATNGFAFPTRPASPVTPPVTMPTPAAVPPTNAAPIAVAPSPFVPPAAPMPPTNAPAWQPRTVPFGNRGTMVTDFSQRPDAPAAPVQVASVAPVPPVGPAKPQTQADFDALPSGALFINPDDGKLRRKK